MKRSTLSMTGLLLLLPLLSACEKSDTGMLMDFLNDWAVQKGIIMEGGLPGFAAISRGLGISSGDPLVDAVIDTGKKLKDKGFLEAEKSAKNAQGNLDKNPPDTDAALNDLDAGLRARPGDWWLLSQRGVLQIENGRSNMDDGDLKRAEEACGVSAICWQRMHSNRLDMLEDSVRRQRAGGGLARCDTYASMALSFAALSDRATEAGNLAAASVYRQQTDTYFNSSDRSAGTCR